MNKIAEYFSRRDEKKKYILKSKYVKHYEGLIEVRDRLNLTLSVGMGYLYYGDIIGETMLTKRDREEIKTVVEKELVKISSMTYEDWNNIYK